MQMKKKIEEEKFELKNETHYRISQMDEVLESRKILKNYRFKLRGRRNT